jgi:prepilin-type N-terminal cleavage/methylation domain-containing protein
MKKNIYKLKGVTLIEMLVALTLSVIIISALYFIIKKSAIHTCHRDANGDFFNNIKNPSYTMIIYLDDMEKCLGVIPKSHFDINSFNYNHEDQVINLLCNKGDAILFNANLIHVGALNNTDDHLRIQLKVTHKEDIEAIPFYNQYNKILDQDNNMPFFLRKAQRKLSCMFPIFSNLTQNEIQDVAGGKEIGIGQRIFSYIFYGNSNFYNLPNAY